jgi:dTDP-4-dehydrorhamnose reductase
VTLRLFDDEFRTPLWLEDAARAVRAIGSSEFRGLIHLAGPQRISRVEMILLAARALGLRTESILPVSSSSMASAEPRPADVSLDGRLMRRTFPDVPSFSTVSRAAASFDAGQLASLSGNA